ncbi:MAG: hypothetical protein NC914_01340, partial [Candidatus Omnitrophica bacterium]|nr:hypothetical protein [Candidatus Omnitrophota bacterium]
IIRIPSRYFLNNQIYNKLISVPTKMLTYLNAFSMSIYAWEAAQAGRIFSKALPLKSVSGVINKVKEVYQQYF